MIKVNRGEVEIVGNEAVVRAEFCVLIRNLKEVFSEHYGAEKAEQKIRKDIEHAFISLDELTEKAAVAFEDILKSSPEKAMKILKEVLANG